MCKAEGPRCKGAPLHAHFAQVPLETTSSNSVPCTRSMHRGLFETVVELLTTMQNREFHASKYSIPGSIPQGKLKH